MKQKPLILPLAAVVLFIVSCDKDSDQQTEEKFDQHPHVDGRQQQQLLGQAAERRLPDRHRVGRRHNDKLLTL